jgi:transcription termination/antitermination protein NusG
VGFVLGQGPGVVAVSKRWFVLRVGTNRESRTKKQLWSRIQTHDLTDKIAQLLVVTERVTEIKGGQRRTVERKVYPGYVMAEIEVDDESGKIPPEVWHLIRDMPGQIKFVGNPDDPDKPQPLGKDEVDKMLAQVARLLAEEPGKTTIDFQVGEQVRIKEGSFENFEGTVEELQPEKGMVKVSIMVFGRPTPIDFESWKVEKVQN